MRNPAYVLKSLEENACKMGYQYERLYRNLYNPEFYLLAYKNIAASQGSMTAGTDGATIDDMSMARINRIIASLKDYSYQPNPARRTYIAKKNSSKKRPLGIPSTEDKLVQEIVRMILEAIFEPTFSNKSHGFRPNRSCHTALLEIQGNFTGAKWMVEGDIRACFDSFDHHVLIALLRRRINDEYFIGLMWKFLRAGYMEQWKHHTTYSGTPQGSGMSPILANIYLSELDVFMEEYKQRFDVRSNGARKLSKQYREIDWRFHAQLKKYEQSRLTGTESEQRAMLAEVLNLRSIRQNTPRYPVIDQCFKSLQYNRYADDFLIGVIGSKADAEQIKADIGRFLQEKLKLTMSEEKTKVTHSGDMVRYLGYDITVSRNQNCKRDKNGILKRVWNGRVQLYLPHDKWVGKLQEYRAFRVCTDGTGAEKWIACRRSRLMNRKDIDIISLYNAEIRGIYNYYRLAQNVSVLGKFAAIMKMSMLKTFAAKYGSSVTKIKNKYTVNGIFSIQYFNKAGEQQCEFYHDGFKRIREATYVCADTLPQYRKYEAPNSFARRLKSGICELCGRKSENICVHHVRTLKELTGKTPGEVMMLNKRRKSLVLCSDCNNQEHA